MTTITNHFKVVSESFKDILANFAQHKDRKINKWHTFLSSK